MITDNNLRFDNGKKMKIQRQSDDPSKKNRKMEKFNFKFKILLSILTSKGRLTFMWEL